MLCEGETNPQPIDFVPHIFAFNRPWNYLCKAITIHGYTGESGSASILSGIKLPTDRSYTGEEVSSILGLDIQFTNMKGYCGEESDSDLDVRESSKLDGDIQTGEESDFELYRELFFDTEISYSGEEILHDLETTPPIRFEYDIETSEEIFLTLALTARFDPTILQGEEGFLDLKLDPLVELENPTVETGELSDADLEDKPSPSIFPVVETGEMGSSYLNVTYAMNPIALMGEYAYTEALNLDTTLEVFGYSGEYADADFFDNSPDNMNPIVSDGSEAICDINRQLTFYPYGIETSEEIFLTFTTSPFSSMIGIGYSGEDVLIPELVEETEYYLSDNNGESVTADLSREISLIFDSGYSGEDAYVEKINLDYIILQADSLNNGQSTTIPLFYVTPSPEFSMDFYTGEYSESDTNIKYYPIFYPEIINSSQNMRDGWGGSGGLNFCPSDCCKGYPDSPHTESYTFDVRPEDREPWGKCGPNEDTRLSFELTGGVRFFPNVYSGESAKSFIDQEYFAFGDMDSYCGDFESTEDENICVPPSCVNGIDKNGDPCIQEDLYWLYNRSVVENKLKRIVHFEPTISVGESIILWWEDPDDFLSLMSQRFSFDLIIEPLIDIFGTGESITAKLSHTESDWKYPFRQNRGGQVVEFTFEANEYFRFCPGYLIPSGDNVIFDFASPIFTDCFGYFIKTGEYSPPLELLINIGIQDMDSANSGETVYFDLFVQGPWLLEGWEAVGAEIINISTEMVFGVSNNYTGDFSIATLDVPIPYYITGTGEHGRLAQLDISLPGIRWITEIDCVRNQYNPLTPDGDLDLEYDNYDICMEYRPYFGKIEAVCDDDVYIYYNILRPEMMANNIFISEPSMYTEKFFELEFNTGETLFIYEFNVDVGESVSCDLSSSPTIILDLEENRGQQNSYSTLNIIDQIILDTEIIYTSESVEATMEEPVTILEFN